MLNKYGEVINNADLTTYNTYGIVSSCKYLIFPKSKEDLKNLIIYLKSNNIYYIILGRGSNVILPDKLINGVVINLKYLDKLVINDLKVYAESGISLSKMILTCINNNLEGLEDLALIPGTLGGALYGNSSCFNNSIYDNLESIEIFKDNKFIILKKEDIKYSYRNTEFKNNNDIIISATFCLKKGNKDKLLKIIEQQRKIRKTNQPLEFKNAGSVFKNPANKSAGALIDSLGLKGYKVNDAMVSLKHANFIVNINKASSKDIKDLINIIKKRVYAKYKIKLELEQIIIDEDNRK